ncbi:ATP-binding protein [Fibrobacter sp. UWB10]|uniref:ATP-binding protein n=1 Tax=Fibrobacter sp. UWB10 TaxID=1896201 RepID=UPI0024B81D7F|nr:ATP-binding protein [Fibrobacter sp. UWB10]
MLESKMTARRLPKPLRRMVHANIAWNACSILGILFFSGPMAPDMSDMYIGRQFIFGFQTLCWVRVGVALYDMAELVLFSRKTAYKTVSGFAGMLVAVALTTMFILCPEVISNLTIFGDRPFENIPIFKCFAIVYALFFMPPCLLIVYQLLRSSLRSLDPTVLHTGAYMAGSFMLCMVIAILFDFVIPIIKNFGAWQGGFQFFVWHQFLTLFLAVLCGQYYTSARFRDLGAHWFLQKLINKIEDGIIYYDEAGRIKAVNHGATKLLGQSSISLRGRSIKNVLPPNLDFFRETVYSDVRMNINGETHVMKIYFFKCRQTLMTVVNIAFFMDQSKTLLLQQNLKTLNEQYVEYTHDLVRYQDRLNKEASIKVEKENVLNTLINALPFRVWYKSELGVYQKQNQMDYDKRGSREGARDNPEDVSPYEKDAREKGEVKVYTSFEDNSGNEISQDEANRLIALGENVQTFDNMYIPILQAGKAPYKTLCLKVDMTEQRRLEYERNMLREQKFIHSRLEELGTMCGAFAHDYNNILGSQIGFCQLAQEMLPPDHQASMFINEALKAAERGKASLEELLNAIRGNANTATPAIVFSPYMIIEDVVKKISLTLPPNISIHSDELDHSLKVRGIVASLDRIISNLANNALFAMKQTGGSLTFKLYPETLESQLVTPYAPPVPAGNYAKFEISDTGTGMDSGTLERIFAPFFTTKAPGEGLGLGLSSALRLLKEGNAYFTVQTTLGEGTTFYLYWPIETETKEG